MESTTELISIERVDDIADISKSIESGLRSVINLQLNSSDMVVIKPNLCTIKSPETGATTDVRVVEPIVNLLREKFGISDISIVESDGEQVLADMAFKLLGFEKLSRRLDVKLVNLSKSPFSIKTFPNNSFLKKVRVPVILEGPRFLISVPKIKTNGMCSFTGTMKNQFGCNPYPHKSIYHRHLHHAIADLYAAYRPDLVVVDALVAMEGMGPVSGTPVKMDSLIVGRDGLAMDHLIARIMGIDSSKVGYLLEARRRRLGTDKYKTVGRSAMEIQRRFRQKPILNLLNLYGLIGT